MIILQFGMKVVDLERDQQGLIPNKSHKIVIQNNQNIRVFPESMTTNRNIRRKVCFLTTTKANLFYL